jgi:hypothetical protein
MSAEAIERELASLPKDDVRARSRVAASRRRPAPALRRKTQPVARR